MNASSQSEDALLYRGMFENAAWGMFQTTPEGYYLTANPALARIYGYDSPADMLAAITNIGRQLYVDHGRRHEFIRLMRQNGALSGFESQIYRRDGTVIWISETCREVRSSTGRLLYYEGSVEDITRRKQAEQQLIAAKEQAEAASRAKSYFLAHMSHELRTPLNAVIGFADVLRNEMLGPLGDARYREYAHDIRNAGHHLLELINNILDLARLGAGDRALEDEEIDVCEFLRACARAVENTVRERDIRFASLPPADRIVLRADAARLKAVVVNLLSNAVKFTPSGRAVTLSAGRTADGGFFARVADAGIGMRPEEVVRALQPFQQIGEVFSRRYEGTGIGLPLAKAFAELHGGSLVIDSVPERGTTATVHLPRWRVIA